MTKLTESQTIILSAGAPRRDNIALPLPKGLAGAAAKMAVTKMIERGWLQEVEAICARANRSGARRAMGMAPRWL
jgi:hypothetical protein